MHGCRWRYRMSREPPSTIVQGRRAGKAEPILVAISRRLPPDDADLSALKTPTSKVRTRTALTTVVLTTASIIAALVTGCRPTRSSGNVRIMLRVVKPVRRIAAATFPATGTVAHTRLPSRAVHPPCITALSTETIGSTWTCVLARKAGSGVTTSTMGGSRIPDRVSSNPLWKPFSQPASRHARPSTGCCRNSWPPFIDIPYRHPTAPSGRSFELLIGAWHHLFLTRRHVLEVRAHDLLHFWCSSPFPSIEQGDVSTLACNTDALTRLNPASRSAPGDGPHRRSAGRSWSGDGRCATPSALRSCPCRRAAAPTPG